MAMVVMTVFGNADAALPPDGGIVHAEWQASIFGGKTMENRQKSRISVIFIFGILCLGLFELLKYQALVAFKPNALDDARIHWVLS
jgi:hypothetical protein